MRDYGLEPQVWAAPPSEQGTAECCHEFDSEIPQDGRHRYTPENSGKKQTAATEYPKGRGNFCRLCGAWRGSYGLEPTIELYVQHTVEIFREVRRVLRKDGTLWLNLGDSYSGGTRGSGGPSEKQLTNKGSRFAHHVRPVMTGLKPKDLCMIPARVALALQADGWWLRSDIIWSKPNPMPESCTDRPTTAHEHIFLLTKSAKYFWDAEAVKEGLKQSTLERGYSYRDRKSYRSEKYDNPPNGVCPEMGKGYIPSGRNLRSVWEIATAPFPEAHFATYPPELVRRCVAAGTSEKGCCPKCGAPWRRVVEKKACTMNIRVRDSKKGIMQHKTPGFGATEAEIANYGKEEMGQTTTTGWMPTCGCTTPAMKRAGCNKNGGYDGQDTKDYGSAGAQSPSETKKRILKSMGQMKEFIWQEACECGLEPVPCTVLDPFSGSGTTGLVAAKMGRDAVLIELNPAYVAMSEKRLRRELGMLAEVNLGFGSNHVVK